MIEAILSFVIPYLFVCLVISINCDTSQIESLKDKIEARVYVFITWPKIIFTSISKRF